MGADTATHLAAPQGPPRENSTRRNHSLRNIADALRLYEELDRAIALLDARQRAELAAFLRTGADALSVWSRRIAGLRAVGRASRTNAVPPLPIDPYAERRTVFSIPLVWEAVGFAIGCAVSFLLI